jgi:hypothetical protein
MGELDSLLELNTLEDRQDEILAAALRAVLCGAVDVDRVAAVLQRRSLFIGDYSMLLGELPTLIQDRDAFPLLKQALTRQPEIGDSAFGRMVAGLLARVWESADPKELNELGDLIGREDLMRDAGRHTDSLPWETDDRPELRRIMAAVALMAGGHSFVPVLRLRILTPRDLTWLIDWMAQAPAGPTRRPGWYCDTSPGRGRRRIGRPHPYGDRAASGLPRPVGLPGTHRP